MRIKISADSTCDLSEALRAKYDISITPLYIEKDGKNYRDGFDIVPQDIYDYVGSGKGVCRTAAVNVGDYLEYFTEYRKSYDAVIHFNISSEMSSCYQNACTAAQELTNVYVVDSRNLSTAIGLLVLEAAERAAAGEAPEKIAETMRETTKNVEASFVIDTLFYLQKGGRCSSLVALGANLLKLKPCIEVKDGKMGVGKKYRGAYERCLRQYVSDRLLARENVKPQRAFLTHTGVSDSAVEAIRALVLQQIPFTEVYEVRAGASITSHCGENTFGIIMLRK